MKHWFERNVICMAVLFVAAGCQIQHPKPSILDNPVCAPPCCQNTTPGMTTHKGFLDSIKSYQYLDQSSIHDYEASWQEFTDLISGRIKFSPDSVTVFDTYFLDDKVAAISFQGDWDLTLGQAQNELGEPTHILVVKEQGEEFVELIIQTKGIAFGYSTLDRPSWWRSRIDPDIRISSIDFYSPDNYQQILDAGLLSYGVLDATETAERMQPWKGYGDLSQYQK